MKYTELDSEQVRDEFGEDIILLVTATNLETEYLHQTLQPINGFEGLVKTYFETQTFYLGVLGKYTVMHVQCSDMGAVSFGGSIKTITDALRFSNAKITIMVGIAFGINPEKQRIGDVLVSESILPYNIKRVGKQDTIHRGKEAVASQFLLNRVKNLNTWECFIDSEQKAKVIPGRLLSGEELVDNLERRKELEIAFPDAKGGEMEGAGMFTACNGNTEWLLVKGICDYADGDKGTNKKERQKIAVTAAISLVFELLSSEFAFSHLNVNPVPLDVSSVSDTQQYRIPPVEQIGKVLFDQYSVECESFYHKRVVDEAFSTGMKDFTIWVHGPSGIGKSNLILRNLLNDDETDFLVLNLAPCQGMKVKDLFKEMYLELATKLSQDVRLSDLKTQTGCLKSLVGLFKEHYSNKKLTILIEEIPISNDKDEKKFSQLFFSLLVLKYFEPDLTGLKLVLSSLHDPKTHLLKNQQKVKEFTKFFPLSEWSEEDIIGLISIIEKGTGFKLVESVRALLITESKGSPRFVKKYFKSLFSTEDYRAENQNFIMNETILEFSN